MVDVPGETLAVTNMHRLTAHTTAGAQGRMRKTESVSLAVHALNPHVSVVVHGEFSPTTTVELTASRCTKTFVLYVSVWCV